jgi:hypothetical protein
MDANLDNYYARDELGDHYQQTRIRNRQDCSLAIFMYPRSNSTREMEENWHEGNFNIALSLEAKHDRP